MDVTVVFAHTRASYPSYTDYYELVRLCGFETCYVDEIDVSRPETVYVVSPLNGEYRPLRDRWRDAEHRALLVLWNLERIEDSTPAAFVRGTRSLLDDLYFDHVWLSDRWLVEQHIDRRVTFTVLGSSKKLGPLGSLPPGEMQWDIIHLSATTHRRRCVWQELEERGVRIAENAWHADRNNRLLRTKFMVNVHKDDWPTIEPLRLALASAYGIPVISEKCHDAWPYSAGGSGRNIVEVEYDELISTVIHRLKGDYTQYRAMGLRMHDKMTTEYEFGRQVRIAAEETWRLRHQRLDYTIR